MLSVVSIYLCPNLSCITFRIKDGDVDASKWWLERCHLGGGVDDDVLPF